MQNINVGTATNDFTGEGLRPAMVKVNANFSDLDTRSKKGYQFISAATTALVPPIFTADDRVYYYIDCPASASILTLTNFGNIVIPILTVPTRYILKWNGTNPWVAVVESVLKKDNIKANLTETVPGNLLDATMGKNLSDAINVTIADEKAMFPSIAHFKRVTADSGMVLDKTLLHKVYTEYLKQLPETKLLLCPELGVKERTSGLNKYGVKMYGLDPAATDAVQLTDATQPFMTVNAAPNSRKGLLYMQGQAQTGLVDFTDVSFTAADSWTLTMRVKVNSKSSARFIIGTTSRIEINNGGIVLIAQSGVNILSCTANVECGKSHTIEFQYSNGVGVIKYNNIPLQTTVLSTAISFGQISYLSATPSDLSIYTLHLTNTRKPESQSQLDHKFLSTIFPEIEGIAIGNQFWATENFNATVDGAGNVIPNVTDNSAWANSTVLYDAAYAAQSGDIKAKEYAGYKAAAMWSYYNNDPILGAIYGKLYNWYAVKLFDINPPRGWRVPSKLDFDQLVAYLGGSTVAGGKLKAKFGGFDNGFSSNESGFSQIPSGRRGSDGSFANVGTVGYAWTSTSVDSANKNELHILNTATDTIQSQVSPIFGLPCRLLRNAPTTPETSEKTTGYVTNNIGVTPYDITSCPCGNSVMFLRVMSETAITGFQAVLYTGAGSAKELLCNSIAISANEPKYIPISVAQSLQLVDFTVRISGTKTDTAARVMYNVGLQSAYKNML